MRRAPALLALATLLCAMPAEAGLQKRMGELPAPRIAEPGDTVALSPAGITFRWSDEGGTRDHYDFRLYEGVSAVGSALLLKEKVDRRTPSITVPAARFTVGKHYAWTVRQVGQRKSRAAYSVFRVVDAPAA